MARFQQTQAGQDGTTGGGAGSGGLTARAEARQSRHLDQRRWTEAGFGVQGFTGAGGTSLAAQLG